MTISTAGTFITTTRLYSTPSSLPPPAGTITENGAKYAFFSGISMATPQVAGSAALVLSQNPNISLQNLRGALVFSGDPLESLHGQTTTGQQGVRAHAVLRLHAAHPNDPPDSSFDGWQFWLNKLNQFGNFIDAEMVKAFIISIEYRQRFGP